MVNPPRLVPNIVISSSTTYPVPAAASVTVYFLPFLFTMNVAAVGDDPDPIGAVTVYEDTVGPNVTLCHAESAYMVP